jgi:2-oxoglutarate dehydrogenase E1 component
VERDEQVGVRLAGDPDAPVQIDIGVALSRQHHAVAVGSEKLVAQGVMTQGEIDKVQADWRSRLDAEFEAGQSYKPNKADWLDGRWSGMRPAGDTSDDARRGQTGVDLARLKEIGEKISSVPADFNVHKTIGRFLDGRRKMIETGQDLDWAMGEALAFATLVDEGSRVRLSGQDCERGTFSQRHAVWVDQNTERKYVPLSTLPHGKFEVYDSTLSEYGVLGFEYGFAMADPRSLVLWEGQFGDFANGAQIMIDQFIASGESKWLRANGLVLLLPHGYEGQGPEHSSARLERFLQMCADDNMCVCNITTPANYFHVLRRQMLRSFRKPLIIMSPKSLLRHPMAKSHKSSFLGERQFRRILSDPTEIADTKVRRLVLCSGKVAYDLIEARDAAGQDDVSIVRIEQLFPFPGDPLAIRLQRMTGLKEVVWCQEEPRNNGAWFFVNERIEDALTAAGHTGMRPTYAGRDAAASPATGLASRHKAQQAALVADALGLANTK